ncbi:hypothetical protein BGW39_006249 [Mortierella sp. 14UC]|nr:hypothetical protein BGW39_006249 [Mortierella sp. 14UC]
MTMDGRTFLPLLVECTKLKRFAFKSNFDKFETNPLEALKQEKWGCRGLEVLDLHFDFLERSKPLTEESEQEVRGIALAAGWEMVPLSFRYYMLKVTHLPKVFELLEFQALDGLRILILEDIPFRRIEQSLKQSDLTPLCRCLRVSKFWYYTLLPILWYGHWTENRVITNLPSEVVGPHCHLLKALQVQDYDFPRIKSAILGCTNLVELSVHVDKDEQINGQTGRLPESQLLRSNPLLKRLTWNGEYPEDPRLNPQDFVGLRNLESLSMYGWDCSDGRLAGVLGAVSGTLKKLTLGINTGLKPGCFSLAPSRGDVCQGKDNGAVSTEQTVLRLGRLEEVSWGCDYTSIDCAAELVRFCPNLKALELALHHKKDLVGLAESLRIHCPYLDSMKVGFHLESNTFKTFFRRCSTSGLHTLDVTSDVSEDDLISGILHHASTLKDLRVFRNMEGMDGVTLLPLLVECTKLKRFAFESNFDNFEMNPLEALKQEKWGCRGLEELDLHFDFLDIWESLTETNEQELIGMAFAAGWEMVPLSYWHYEFNVTHLPKVFELLEVQGLEELRRLVLSEIPFRRTTRRIKHCD